VKLRLRRRRRALRGRQEERRPEPLGRRLAVGALVILEAAVMVWLLAGPGFAVRHVDVVGARRLSPAQIEAAGGFGSRQTVFTLDAATIARKLGGIAWVREASVEPELPDRVLVRVDEWQPIAVFRAGAQGRSWFLSNEAVALGQAPPASAGLLDLQWPAGPEPKPGQKVMDVDLLNALVNMQKALPGLLGQEVQSFTLDPCGNLTLTSKKGWKAYFGRVLTPEEFATLRDKLAALKSISAAVDYGSPDL